MASNSSVSGGDEKLVQDPYKQTNGEVSQKTATIATPRPQRVLRLNRRGFFLSKEIGQNPAEGKVNKTQHHESITVTQDSRIKSPPQTGKKIIKLSNSSNSDAGSNHSQKRHSSDTPTSDTDLTIQDMPPKKKHKLITWP